MLSNLPFPPNSFSTFSWASFFEQTLADAGPVNNALMPTTKVAPESSIAAAHSVLKFPDTRVSILINLFIFHNAPLHVVIISDNTVFFNLNEPEGEADRGDIV